MTSTYGAEALRFAGRAHNATASRTSFGLTDTRYPYIVNQ